MKNSFKKGIAIIGAVGALGSGAVFGADKAIDPYVDKGTFQELSIKSNIPQGERIEIHKDKAQMDLVFWNDEKRISIKPQLNNKDFNVASKRSLLSKRMEYKLGDITAFIKPKINNEFDIDFILESKPDTNIFIYKIDGAEDFDFFYQPELTQQEIADSADRPDNVVGSYAVYHKTKANHRVGSTNYATGKAFHIYRPKVIDANGVERWAELSYKNGILSVIIPQNFLNGAVYPVVVDPTFGYESIGATIAGIGDDIVGSEFSLAESGKITSMSLFIYDNFGSFGNAYKMGIYDTSGNFQAESEAGTVPSNFYQDWVTNNFTTPYSINNGNWVLVAFSNNGGWGMKYDSGETGQGYRDIDGTWSTFDDPATFTSEDRKYSIYATYTADAPENIGTFNVYDE